MNLLARCLIALVVAAGFVANGAVPTVNIAVADSSGKTAFKGATNSNGVFMTPKLTAGSYAVQFTSSSAPKGSHYTLALVAGPKKMSASAVTAEKLAAGGVAMKIEVGAGGSIQGQVAAESGETRIGKNGQLMVWIPKRIGSNIPAHWAESDSAEAKEVMTSGSYSLKNMQNKQNQGVSPLNDTGGKTSTSSMQNPATGH
jgi:hypothetical protein